MVRCLVHIRNLALSQSAHTPNLAKCKCAHVYLLQENYDPRYDSLKVKDRSDDQKMAFGDENVEDSDLCLQQD